MGRFNSENGLIQLIFAREDDYYLDSLVKMNRSHYLYYLLKKEGYKKIFFVNQEKIKTFDQISEETWKKYWEKKSFLEKRTFAKKINELMGNGREKIALVCGIEDYDGFMDKTKLYPISQDFARKMSIFIVFTKNDAHVMQALKARREDFFIEFKEEFDEEFPLSNSSLNGINKKTIRNLVLHSILVEKKMDRKLMNLFEDYVDFIYSYFHSISFRQKIEKRYGRLWSIAQLGEENSLKIIGERLRNPSIWIKMQEIIGKIRKEQQKKRSLLSILEETEKFDESSILSESSSFSSQLNYLKEQLIDKNRMDLWEMVDEIQKQLPLKTTNQLEKEKFNQIRGKLLEALLRKENLLLTYAIKAMHYFLCRPLLAEQSKQSILDCYQKIFEFLAGIRETEKSKREISKQIEQMEKKFDEQFVYINELEIQEGYSSVEMEMQKKRYVNLAKSIEQWKKIEQEKEQEIIQFEDWVKNLELAIKQLDSSTIDNLEEVVGKVQKQLQQSSKTQLKSIQEMQKEIEEELLNTENELTYEELQKDIGVAEEEKLKQVSWLI